MGKILGIDISNNNMSHGPIDFNKVAASGVKFVYVKATEGRTFKDGYMEQFVSECKENNLQVGAYHFLVASSQPEDQAQNFYEKIKGTEWDLIPMLDVETMNGFTAATICDYVLRFIDRFRSLTDIELGIYSYTSFIQNLEGISAAIGNLKLWEANYNGQPWNLSDNFFNNRIGHQYTEKGTIEGISGICDVNEFTEDILLVDKNWVYDETKKKWWYKLDNGKWAENEWKKIQGKRYRFDADGWMITGWFQDEKGEWYYLYSSGAMASGWIKDTQWFYLKPDSGVMAKNEVIVINGEKYSFADNGHMETTNDRGALV